MKKITKHPKLIVGIVLVATILLGLFLPKIVVDNDVRIFFPEDDPSFVRIESLDDELGSQILMAISVTNDDGSIFTPEVIDTLRYFVEEIELMNHVEGVQALTNSDFPTGTDEGMEVGPLVPDDFGGTPADFAELKRKLLDWSSMYRRTLFSDDFASTQLIVEINWDAEADEIGLLYEDIKELISQQEGKYGNLSFRIAGDPVISQEAKNFMYKDLAQLIPLVVLVVLLSLYFSFRKIRGTLLPLITVLISTIWTVGIMAAGGIPFSIVSTCLPVLLIAVGSAYGIHMMNHYYAALSDKAGKIDFETHRTLVAESSAFVVKPIMLAGFTTIVGFGSVCTSPIVPLKEFGIFSAIGVGISLLLALTFIPSILVLFPPKKMAKQDRKAKNKEGKLLEKAHEVLSRRRGRIIFVSLAAIALSVWGITKIDIESALLEYFPKTSQMRVDTDYINDEFGGTSSFSVVVRAPEGEGIIKPEVLKAMDDMGIYLKSKHPGIGKTLSFTEFIKRMNQIMNYPPAAGAATEEAAFDDAGSDPGFGGDEFGSFFGEESQEDDGFGSFFEEESATTETEAADDFGSFFDEEEAPAAEGSSESVENLDPAEVYGYDRYSQEMSYSDFLEIMSDAMAGRDLYDMSAEELVENLQRNFNYKGADYYEIPYDPAKYPVASKQELGNLVSQYLLLYSGSLDSYANDPLDPSMARLVVQMRTHATGIAENVMNDVYAYAENHFPEGYSVECTGIAELETALTGMITSSQISSLLVALLVVFIIVAISYRSPVAGFFGIIPLAMAILVNFGIMGLTGIKLDMITSLIASIAIGIGVDYTIHFLNNYHHERLKSDDLDLVTRNTILLSGKAIIINAVSVALGFLVLVLSGFVVLRYIGLLVAIIMITSSVAAMTILPVLLNTFKPAFISRPLKTKTSEAKASGKEKNYA